MYPIDRRALAAHIYSLVSSLRQTANLLQTSHSTISRWLRDPKRKQYVRSCKCKGTTISEAVRVAIVNDPFISIIKLQKLIFDTFSFKVSRELIRLVIKKHGLTRKKAKFFSAPKIDKKTNEFLNQRETYKRLNYKFLSLDETSFGRNTKAAYGYAMKNKPLSIKRKQCRRTTVSSIAIMSNTQIVKRQTVVGSYNTVLFCAF